MHGTVIWRHAAKGYGYIAPAEGGEDVFARLGPDDDLAVGDPVTFRVVEGPLGPEARHLAKGHQPDDDMG